MTAFSGKLKEAMQQLGISQVQVVGMTGCSKGSVSQYLSGKQVPSQDRQRDIAVSLGLAPDYFEQEDPVVKMIRQGCGTIPEIRTKDAGKLMRMSHTTVEDGLKQGVFPWGYAVLKPSGQYRYFINARRFAEHEGIEVPPEMVV